MIKIALKIITKIKRKLNNLEVAYLRSKHLARFKYSQKIILLLLPNDDSINGGILSIVSIFNEFNSLKGLHECDVIAATHTYRSNEYFLKFSKFKNNMIVFDLKRVLKKIQEVKELHIHIPELFLKEFIDSFEKEWSSLDKKKLLNMDVLHINILNQNDMLMPDYKYIDKIKELVTENVTMTVAHKKYATIDKRNKYNVSLHYLSAWLNPVPYEVKSFAEKENVILFSPDELARLNIIYHCTKQDLIDMLKIALPDFEIIVIENLTYDDYKALVSKSKFMITLGEGLDGYFIETVLSGGIAFAVYNDKFFTEDYKNLPTVYESIDDLFKKIVRDIDSYNDKSEFTAYHQVLKDIVEIEYSYQKYQNRVKNYILGNYDFK
ncbi:hypothetical protein SAMN05444395_10578 [Flavobacterium fryxellicola]|uniref:Glycosyltransferase n=1 Tax=Flavobacterium fryxellicola TaxID=249352 RepID=A0A167V1K3_9FLAO|nr:hypothetical protein [Flavobacterium fryxellicola]OAB25995.1 hypothetical protein FBFR_13870 [Flavobacterium fryxellicola]SHN69457.1 hypothetical protein SAMN05444395_10578 [Flavobacterium fryxellicola]